MPIRLAIRIIPIIGTIMISEPNLFAAQAEDETFFHTSMCDASAGAILDEDSFVVANDEDNSLRIFRSDGSGGPIATIPLSGFLRVDEKHPETDIEGAAWLGDYIYWITSHGRNKDGKKRESRHRFFATRVTRTSQGWRIAPALKPYRYLLRDLIRERSLRPFDLAEAGRLAPKEPGGLNIESLSATPEGHLLIGFRNPIPDDLALLVPCLNPEGVLRGQSAQFGEVIRLDLQGYGVRDMAWTGRDYLLIAGSFDAEGVSRIYRWNGSDDAPQRVDHASFQGFNPEALLQSPKHPERLLVLSDDGTMQVGGADCKTLTDPTLKRFRSRWLTLAPSPAP